MNKDVKDTREGDDARISRETVKTVHNILRVVDTVVGAIAIVSTGYFVAKGLYVVALIIAVTGVFLLRSGIDGIPPMKRLEESL